jgi:hypothetical protein
MSWVSHLVQDKLYINTNEEDNNSIAILSIKDLKVLKNIKTFNHNLNCIMSCGRIIVLSFDDILLILDETNNYIVLK